MNMSIHQAHTRTANNGAQQLRQHRNHRPLKHPFQILLGLLAICSLARAPLQADDFQDGIDAYHQSNYQQASEAFQKALQTEESAAVHHNLALSAYQQNKPSEAIWHLERAVRLDPLNKAYNYKLGALRQQLGLYQVPVQWWQAASRYLAPSTWVWIICLSAWIILAANLLPRAAGRRRTITLKLITAAALFSLALSIAALSILKRHQATGTLIAEEPTPLHYAPASAAPEAGLARPGERARVIDQHNNYLKIKTEADITGWIDQNQFKAL
jgi:tetratricopeptide (TPR) repeat protein